MVRLKPGWSRCHFGLYKALSKWLLLMGGGEGIFGHLFLVVSWNLACHSANTCAIQLQHFQWVEDSFQVFFAHQKNDKTGKQTRWHPQNIYPNPVEPLVCPLLSLSLYFTVFPDILVKDGALFPGRKPVHSFFPVYC